MSKAKLATAKPAERQPTALEVSARSNPWQVHRIDPDDASQLLIITDNWDGRHPYGRNTRPTPPVGHASLSDLIRNMEDHTDEASGDYGQLQPAGAVLNPDGIAELYFGFNRARAIQTRNIARRAQGLPPIPLNVIITDRELTEKEIVARSLAENAFRKNPSLLQVAETVAAMKTEGLGVVEIGKRIGVQASKVSNMSRFVLFPANVKRALAAGKLDYSGAIKLIPMLPKSAALKTDEGGKLLQAAQERIAARWDGIAGGKGRRTPAAHRKAKQMLSEIGAAVDKEAGSDAGRRLESVAKYIDGGGFKALVKALR
jgi:ParB-like chromosome segregation protein Spo0J